MRIVDHVVTVGGTTLVERARRETAPPAVATPVVDPRAARALPSVAAADPGTTAATTGGATPERVGVPPAGERSATASSGAVPVWRPRPDAVPSRASLKG